MKEDKLFETFGRMLVAADVSIASAAMFKTNDARDMIVASVLQPTLLLLDESTNDK